MAMEEEEARKALIHALKYHGADWHWVETANMFEDEGKLYIQTEGDDATFPRGKWDTVESILEVL